SVINSMRRAAGRVGFRSTCATPGSPMSSVIATRWRRHSSTRPSSRASSKTALAYLLAAAVATRNLLNGLVDELLVLGQVERPADALLGSGHDQARHLAAHRLDRLHPVRLNFLARRLDQPLGLLFSLL